MTFAVVEHRSAYEWDQLVGSHPHDHLLQRWGWGDLKGDFGWKALRLAVVGAPDPADGASSAPVAAAQILIRRSFGLAVCYVPRGPLFSGDPALDAVLLSTLRTVARRERAAFLRLEPNLLESSAEAGVAHSMLQIGGYRVAEPLQPRTSIHLDLSPPPERLFAAFSKGHRADVRRAERGGVIVRTGTTLADLDAFYQIMQQTAARAEFAIHSREYYRKAWEIGGDGARLLIASLKGEDVAAFLIFGLGSEGQYMYSGANDAGLKSGANHLLQWHAIQWTRSQGCRRYDLWGIPEAIGRMVSEPESEREQAEQRAKSDPLYGAYRFKKGWGGDVVRYLPAYDQVYLAPAYWFWRRRGGE